MKIPLIYIPKTRIKKFLVFRKRFRYDRTIVPIGCDCHPAYVLRELGLRKYSLPFDWLSSDPLKGLDLVRENIETKFNYFLKDLFKNERGEIVSARFNYSEFIHEKDLLENEKTRLKMHRRIERFSKIIESEPVTYLYTTTSDRFTNEEEVRIFLDSINKFLKILKYKDSISIYIRYDENLEENTRLNDLFIDKVKSIKGVHVTRYVRYKSEQGIWGHPSGYRDLLINCGLRVRLIMPEIKIV